MSTPAPDPALVRKRNFARAERLKRRFTAASMLGFVAFFGLAAQHVVRGASASTRPTDPATQRVAASSATTYFDQRDDGFSFATPASDFQQSAVPAQQPMAQSSVS